MRALRDEGVTQQLSASSLGSSAVPYVNQWVSATLLFNSYLLLFAYVVCSWERETAIWDRLVRVWIVKAVCSVEVTGQSTGEQILSFHHVGIGLGLVARPLPVKLLPAPAPHSW